MYNAGILLYTHKDDETLFLLGKDARWKQWSDFGGKNDLNDVSMHDTAIREFYEESMGVIFDTKQIKHLIVNCNYIKTLSYRNHDYFMFLLHIKYNDLYIRKFKTIHSLNLNVPKKFKEKTEIKWFSLRDIIDNSYDMRSVFHKTVLNNLDKFRNL